VTGFTPPVDVHETEDEYLVKVDLPGVKSEDVNIEVNDSVLSLSGSRVVDETEAAALRSFANAGRLRVRSFRRGRRGCA
jgi:HSP20 family molecular chaperone IbpA